MPPRYMSFGQKVPKANSLREGRNALLATFTIGEIVILLDGREAEICKLDTTKGVLVVRVRGKESSVAPESVKKK